MWRRARPKCGAVPALNVAPKCGEGVVVQWWFQPTALLKKLGVAH